MRFGASFYGWRIVGRHARIQTLVRKASGALFADLFTTDGAIVGRHKFPLNCRRARGIFRVFNETKISPSSNQSRRVSQWAK